MTSPRSSRRSGARSCANSSRSGASTSGSPEIRAAGSPRTRAERGTAEQRIVTAAIELFAEEGFRATTRDLARRLGVTQALLYRYFRSKQALIERVFDEVLADRWDEGSTERLLDRSSPLSRRLTAFYQAFARRFSRQRIRLFMRAGLDDQKLAARYTFPLNDRVLTPVIAALRQEAGLPPPAERPVLRAERELAMTLHGVVAHLGIRKYIYDSPLPDNLDAHVAFYVRCFLEGALDTIRQLHEEPPKGRLGARLASRRGAPIE